MSYCLQRARLLVARLDVSSAAKQVVGFRQPAAAGVLCNAPRRSFAEKAVNPAVAPSAKASAPKSSDQDASDAKASAAMAPDATSDPDEATYARIAREREETFLPPEPGTELRFWGTVIGVFIVIPNILWYFTKPTKPKNETVKHI